MMREKPYNLKDFLSEGVYIIEKPLKAEFNTILILSEHTSLSKFNYHQIKNAVSLAALRLKRFFVFLLL